MYRRKAKTRYVPNQEPQEYGNSNYAMEQQEYVLQQQGNEIEPEQSIPSQECGVQKRSTGSRTTLSKKNNSRRKENHLSYYAYGKSAAIEFVCDETKKHRIATIAIQAASAKEHERGYAWEDKTVIQVPRNELLHIAAIMLGKEERAEFRHSTQYTSKSYVVEHQGGKIFFMVSEKGKPIRAVGLSPEDSYQVLTLFMRQIKSNAPWLTVEEIIILIDRTALEKVQRAAESPDEEEKSDYHADDDYDGDDSYDEDTQPIELYTGDEEVLNTQDYIELKY